MIKQTVFNQDTEQSVLPVFENHVARYISLNRKLMGGGERKILIVTRTITSVLTGGESR